MDPLDDGDKLELVPVEGFVKDETRTVEFVEELFCSKDVDVNSSVIAGLSYSPPESDRKLDFGQFRVVGRSNVLGIGLPDLFGCPNFFKRPTTVVIGFKIT